MPAQISVIIPALNESSHIEATLAALQPLRQQGHEVIVVDGGSGDDTVARARPGCDRVLASAPGRAHQQNVGARAAHGDLLWFLHADTVATPQALAALARVATAGEAAWGRFDVRLSGAAPALRLVATAMNLRSRLSSIATGDQGLFVRRDCFQRVGGFAEQPLLEDIELCRRLKRVQRPCCLRARLVTSSRRWEQDGVVPTVLLMWAIRAAYFLGAGPERLARWYARRSPSPP